MDLLGAYQMVNETHQQVKNYELWDFDTVKEAADNFVKWANKRFKSEEDSTVWIYSICVSEMEEEDSQMEIDQEEIDLVSKRCAMCCLFSPAEVELHLSQNRPGLHIFAHKWHVKEVSPHWSLSSIASGAESQSHRTIRPSCWWRRRKILLNLDSDDVIDKVAKKSKLLCSLLTTWR